jgi:hypothetical protein
MSDQEQKHVTPEMAALILEVTEAEKKDMSRLDKWKKARDEERKLWEAKSPQEKQELTKLGAEYKYDLPEPASKWVRNIRRKIRYRLFRIREGKSEYDNGLKAWIEMQFSENMNWGNFTFEWDVSAEDPLRVITPMEWLTTGGQLIFEPGTKTRACDPAAFTKQEM